MRLPKECYQMQQVIETHLSHLSRPQSTGLVPVSSTGQTLWVCGYSGRQRLPEHRGLRPHPLAQMAQPAPVSSGVTP